MIQFEQRGNHRVYPYLGKMYKLNELYEHPDCVVSRPTLGMRLSNGIAHPDIYRWESVEECVTTPTIAGRPTDVNDPEVLGRKAKVEKKKLSKYLSNMALFKPGSEANNALIMQSRPILRSKKVCV